MHLNDLLFLFPKISFFPNLHPEMFPEYVFEREFTNSASFFTEKRGASFSQFPLFEKKAFSHGSLENYSRLNQNQSIQILSNRAQEFSSCL